MVLDGTSLSSVGLITAGNPEWTDYTVSAEGRLMSESGLNKSLTLVVRFESLNDIPTGNYYWAGIGAFDNQYCIGKTTGFTTHTPLKGIGSENLIEHDHTYKIQVQAIGDVIRLFVDGALVLEYSGVTIPNGTVGIRNYYNRVQIDYFQADATSPIQGNVNAAAILALGAGLSLITAEPLPLIAATAYVLLTTRR